MREHIEHGLRRGRERFDEAHSARLRQKESRAWIMVGDTKDILDSSGRKGPLLDERSMFNTGLQEPELAEEQGASASQGLTVGLRAQKRKRRREK